MRPVRPACPFPLRAGRGGRCASVLRSGRGMVTSERRRGPCYQSNRSCKWRASRSSMIRGEMLPQIEAFLEVARRQNLSRAPEALFVPHPTLTARLQSLESSLGERLFVRTRRGMRLTEAGETFLPFAEHAVAALAGGGGGLDGLRRGVAGRLG